MSSASLLTPSIITKESLVILENNLVAANRVNRKFENQFVKIGASLTIRKPNKFTIATGPGLVVQDIAEPSVSITVNKQKQVAFQFTSQDLTLTVEEFSERYLKPAMATMANQVDVDVLGNVTAFSNFVGTNGTTPGTFSSSVQLVGRRMDDLATPQDNRTLVLNPNAYWTLANSLTGLFVMPTAKDAIVKGYLATIGNFEIYMDQNTPTFSTGIHVTTNGVTITGGQTGTSLSTAGWNSTDTFVIGEVITIAGVNAINPQNRQSTGVLKPFVITAAVGVTSSDARSTATLTISPSLLSSGPYQTVNQAPTVSSVISFLTPTNSASSTTPNNMGFTRDAMGLVMVPMEIPGGVDFAARETYRNISMRVIRAYDINNDVFPTRIDILYGTAQYYDELGVRLAG
jgi:hypothetical protein